MNEWCLLMDGSWWEEAAGESLSGDGTMRVGWIWNESENVFECLNDSNVLFLLCIFFNARNSEN